DAGPQLQRRIHAEPAWRLHMAAVVAHVLDAGVRVPGDVLRERRIGRDVPAGRRDRERNPIKTVAGLIERRAFDDDLMAWRVLDDARWDRTLDRAQPALVHLLERAAKPDAIDLAVGRKPADQHRDVVFAALAVDHIGEQERLAVLLGDAATELPA